MTPRYYGNDCRERQNGGPFSCNDSWAVEMTALFRLCATACCLVLGLRWSQDSGQGDPRGKSHTLYGTVEAIYDSTQSIRVSQDKIEGYSEARVATYRVDDAEILKKLQVDDKIVATIYEKDLGLYDIRIVRIDDKVRPPR